MGLFDSVFGGGRKRRSHKKGWSSGNNRKYGYKGSTVRDAGFGKWRFYVVTVQSVLQTFAMKKREQFAENKRKLRKTSEKKYLKYITFSASKSQLSTKNYKENMVKK